MSLPATRTGRYQAVMQTRNQALVSLERQIADIERRVAEEHASGVEPDDVPRAGKLSRAVLLVEDDDDFRAQMAQLLRQELDLEVYEASNTAAADLIWKAHRPAVIVCDMHFSLGENGDRWLRTIPKPVGKMLVSGTVTHNTLTLAAEMSGALARIKPPDEVVEDVRQLLALALASSSL